MAPSTPDVGPMLCQDVASRPGSATSTRHVLATYLSDAGADRLVIQDATHVLYELVMNAVEHGRPDPAGNISVGFGLDDTHLVMSVRDSGDSAARQPIAALEPSADRPRGRELQMVQAMSTRWLAHHDARGTTVTAWLHVA